MSRFTSAAATAAAVRGGQIRAAGLVDMALQRIRAEDTTLNCFTAVLADQAMADARKVDDAVRLGRDPGPLAGVPFAVKNLFDIKGLTTLAGSVIEADKRAAGADAPLVARLRAAGAVLVGALNMDEYAYGFTTENSHYGPTRNPHDPARVSGGSSGGSAAAVAAGFVPLTLGSDTNGSIRVPASFCGVFGLKPTFGRLSRRGVTPFVHSLDHVGPFARSVEDLALAYDVCQGPDSQDSACANKPVERVQPQLVRGPKGLKAGVLGGWFQDTASPDARLAAATVGDALAAKRDIELKGAGAARAAAFGLTGYEGGGFHLDDLRARPQDFDPATRDRLIAGALQPEEVIARAHLYRRQFLAEAKALFEKFDVLIAPSTPFSATRLDEPMINLGGKEVLVRANAGLYTQPISFIGLPVLACPVRVGTAMPIGVQLIAAPWNEALLFRVAAFLEHEGTVGVIDPLPIREMVH
jgi:AtzE family amidohydrolase